MNERSVRFLWGLFIWEIIVFVSIAIVFLYAGRQLRADDAKFLGPVALLGILVTAVCWVMGRKVGAGVAVLLGTLCGVVFAVLGGFVLAHVVGGFESSAAIFMGSLMLTI